MTSVVDQHLEGWNLVSPSSTRLQGMLSTSARPRGLQASWPGPLADLQAQYPAGSLKNLSTFLQSTPIPVS